MKFKNYIETESGIKDTSSEPGTVGQVLSSTGTGTSWIDQSSLVSAASKLVVISCKNTSGSTINKGTPVYQTGTVGATDVIEVAPADATISTGSLPAIGILQTTLINNNDPETDPGNVVITGEFLNYSTANIPTNNPGGVPITGDTVYLAAGGGLTCIKPTGAGNAIQNLGLIGKVSGGSAGSITVSSIMRANDVPNLPTGKIWIGDGNTIVSDTVYVDEPNNRVGIGTISPNYKLDVTGDAYIDETLNIETTISGTLSYGYGGVGAGNLVVGGLNFASFTPGVITLINQDTTISAGQDLGVLQFGGKADAVSGYANGQIICTTAGGASSGNTGGGIFRFLLSNNTTGSSLTERMRITNNGNVGVGTTSPSSKLQSVTSTSGPIDYFQRSAILGLNDSTDTLYANSVGVAGRVKTSGGRAIYGEAQGSGWGGYFDGKGFFSSNVGIGTTSPGTFKLAVAGSTAIGENLEVSDGLGGDKTLSIDATIGAFQIGDIDGIGGGAHIEGDSSNIKIFTSGSETLVCNSVGNVGIGTTSPQAKLHVANGLLRTWAPTSGTSAIFESTVSNRNFVTLTAANEAELWFGNAATQAKGRVRYEMANDNMEFWTNATQKMVIDGSGDVGIGTTNPNAKLEVAGSTRITGTGLDVGYGNNGTNYVQVGFGRTTNGFALLDLIGDSTYTDYGFRILRNNGGPNTDTDIIHRGTGDLDLKTVEAGDIGFHTTSIQRMIVKSDGDVGIGTTNPSQKLHVVGRVASTAGNGFQIINSYGSPLLGDFYGTFTTTSPLYVGGPYSAQACYASAFNINSDYRLKENEAPLTEASNRIKKLKPIRFNYISSENTVDGFLAHEVAEVIPEAVTGEKDAVREDGSDELQGLDLSKIVPLLTAALQESITKIEQLEQRIQTLENK